jgi:hypothetical protein
VAADVPGPAGHRHCPDWPCPRRRRTAAVGLGFWGALK